MALMLYNQCPVYENVVFLRLNKNLSRAKFHAFGFFFFGIACIGLALMGLLLWIKADYFTDPGPYGDGWVGYDTFTFFGLLLFTIFSSIGVALSYVGVGALMRLFNNSLCLFFFGAVGFIFVVIGSLGITWGKETMGCLVIFCVNTTKYVEVDEARPENGLGFLSFLGIAIFLSLLPVGLVALMHVVVRVSRTDQFWYTLGRGKRHTTKNKSVIFYGGSMIFVITLWAFITFYLPNSWGGFTAERIAKSAQHVAVRDGMLCKNNPKKYVCPELPWSWVFTHNWVWSEMIVLKMYPSNIFFFMYIVLLLLTVTVIQANCTGRKLLRRRFFFLRSFTCGEVGFVILTMKMLLLFFLYWILGHNFDTHWLGGTNANIRASERWARSLGQLSVAFLSICIFPASRCSILHSVLGTSWESSLWVHKVLGYGMLLTLIGHMIGWYIFYGQNGNFPGDIFSIPMKSPMLANNFTVPLVTLTSFFMLVAVGIFALEPVRRRFFELFYYLHILAFYIITPSVLLHAAASWEYLLPGLTVWFLDKLLRMYRSASTVEVLSAVASDSYVKICFLHPPLTPAPGQYAFVNIPELSLLQWHPFSFSSVDSDCFTLHIKSMGEGTWAGQLVDLVNKYGNGFKMSVDGPYGRVHDFFDYSLLVLVAGGIGVTPCAAIYSYLRQQKNRSIRVPTVILLWSVHDVQLVFMMSHLWNDDKCLSRIGDACDPEKCFLPLLEDAAVPLRLFFTGDPCDKILSLEEVFVSTGRLDADVEIPHAIGNTDPSSVLVFASGPAGLVKQTRDAAIRIGANFHEEIFLL